MIVNIIIFDQINNTIITNKKKQLPYVKIYVVDLFNTTKGDINFLFKLSINAHNAKNILQKYYSKNNINTDSKYLAGSPLLYKYFINSMNYLITKLDIDHDSCNNILLYLDPEYNYDSNVLTLILKADIGNINVENYNWTQISEYCDTSWIFKRIQFYNKVYTLYNSPIIHKRHLTFTRYLSSETLESTTKEKEQNIFIGITYAKVSPKIGLEIMVSKSGPYHSVPMFKIKMSKSYDEMTMYAIKKWFIYFAKQNIAQKIPCSTIIGNYLKLHGISGSKSSLYNNLFCSETKEPHIIDFLIGLQQSLATLTKFLGTNKDLTFHNLFHGHLILFQPDSALFTFVCNSMSHKLPDEYNTDNITFLPLSIFNTIHNSRHKETYPKNWISTVIKYTLEPSFLSTPPSLDKLITETDISAMITPPLSDYNNTHFTFNNLNTPQFN
jgi:hypothetical protein